jgi:hypothetical protein
MRINTEDLDAEMLNLSSAFKVDRDFAVNLS